MTRRSSQAWFLARHARLSLPVSKPLGTAPVWLDLTSPRLPTWPRAHPSLSHSPLFLPLSSRELRMSKCPGFLHLLILNQIKCCHRVKDAAQRHAKACDPPAAAVHWEPPLTDQHVGHWGSWEVKQRGPQTPQVRGKRPGLMAKGLGYRQSAENHMCKVLPTTPCSLPTTFMIHVESGLF